MPGRLTRVGVAALVAAMLAGCSGGGDSRDAGPGDAAGAVGGKQRTEQATPDVPKVAVASDYDNTRGWYQQLGWPDPDASTWPVTTAPKAGLVAYVEQADDGYVLQARDAKSGRDRFRTPVWEPPVALRESSLASMPEYEDEELPVEIPEIDLVEVGGKEYLVVWARGVLEADGLGKARQAVRWAVYPAAGEGSTKPLHQGDFLIGDATEDRPRAIPSPHGLLIYWYNDRPGLPPAAALVNPATGKVDPVETDGYLPVAMSAKGAVLTQSGGQHFVLDGWSSEDVTPEGGNPGSQMSIGADGGLVASLWPWEEDRDEHIAVWGIQDAESGRLVAAETCSRPDFIDLGNGSWRVSSSSNGRYAVVGPVLFDVEKGEGYCFGETDDREGVTLDRVFDDGRAFGWAVGEDGESDGRRVTARPDTSAAELLPDAGLMPVQEVGGSGLFPIDNERGVKPGFVVYPGR